MTTSFLCLNWSLLLLHITMASCQHQGSGIEPMTWPFDNPNKFAFIGSSTSQDLAGSENGVVPPASKMYNISDGRRAAVFDNVLMYRTSAALLSWLELKRNWRFHTNSTHAPGNLHHVASDYRRGAPWTSSYDPREFSSFEAGKTFLSLARNVSNSQEDLSLREVTELVLRKGDSISLHHDSSSRDTDYTILVFLNHLWFKNDYGELMLYDNNENVFAAVTPKFNRAVVWDSSIDYLTRPPSMGCIQSQLLLMLRYTTDTTKAKDSYTAYQLSENELQQQREKIFGGAPLTGVDEEIDVAKHIVQKYKSSQNKKIFVLDNLFPSWILDTLRQFTLDYGLYNFDDSIDITSDNVQWIAGFDIDSFIKTRVWYVIKQVVSHVSGHHNRWFPYDVSCNLIRSFDHTRIHEDCNEDEDEWTFLLYLNPEWDYNCQGETVYMETGGDEAEYITTVLPKFGRAVIFQGIIPHSARPPSSACQQPRLSFAVKVSENEYVAWEKNLVQASDREEGTHLSMLRLLQLMQDEDFDEKYQEEMREEKKQIVKLKQILSSRYMSSDDDDDDDDEDENENHDEEKEGELDADVPSEYRDFPQLLQQKKFIYTGIIKAEKDPAKLRNHYLKFKEQFTESIQKYIDLFATILGNQ